MAHKRKLERMTFTESLNILGIQKYEQRILNSNSHGELIIGIICMVFLSTYEWLTHENWNE